MRFKTDENLPVEAAELLRQAGFDALSVHEQGLSGAKDPQLAIVCQDEGRAIVPLDGDFADIRTYPPERYSGILVFKPASQAKAQVLALLKRLVPVLSAESLTGKLWIADERRIRIRGDE